MNKIQKLGLVLSVPVLCSMPAMAALDISAQITAFTGSAEDYVEAALPAVFVIVGLYFLIKVIKRFTK